MKKPYSTLLTVIAILAIGIAVFAYFTNTRKSPSRSKHPHNVLTVETTPIKVHSTQAVVTAMGKVISARSVTVFPQVGGRVVWISKQMIPGGHLGKGETLLRIDQSDYKLNLKAQQSTVAQAKLTLAQEEGRQAAAKLEWSLIEHEVQPTEAGLRLATREIQVESAKTALSAAESSLEKARLDLSRTEIRAPFSAFVTGKGVDVGQVVSAQTALATLVDSDVFWVQISVPVEKLQWIELPSKSGEGGSKAKISQSIGDKSIVREGRIIKLLADLDMKGKTAQLLVRIEDPFGLRAETEQDDSNIPLMLGSYVRVDIQGKPVENIVTLPGGALHEESKIWIRNNQGRLEIRPVELLWRTSKAVYLRGEFKDGENVITSRIQIPVPGMELLKAGEKATGKKPRSKSKAAKHRNVEVKQ